MNKDNVDCRKNDKWDSPEGAMKVLKIIGMVILGIAAAFAFGLAVQLLWNWLMPLIFGLTKITYWQGIGVLVLSFILFGRLGGGSSDDSKKDKGVRGEIKKEIKKEIDKEFQKETNKEENMEFEELYEKWLENEGAKAFENFMKQKAEKADVEK